MLSINKISDASAIHYAADELRKYLRMMMPEGGDIKVAYNPEAKCGFRLGLMQDLGLDVSDAEDPELDDILYIDCDKEGGIIAGSNPRSVLLAVYEYLRQNGCRWLMPGVDGEFIPMQDIKPVKYRHKPSMRYRGWCNEGSESQQCMLDAIEFLPKVGMNVFMMEFRIPSGYYRRYYNHLNNEANRPEEPVSNETVLAWKRMCEAELSRRGLQFHDIGHGWTVDPFGIDSSLHKWDGDNEDKIPPESRKYLALLNGERKLYSCTPNLTNFCMSNEEARKIFVRYVADYAEHHGNSDYLHVWLADGFNKHCECESCQSRTTSDWYIILLNELDEELTARALPTRIVFIAYNDTVWAPLTERIKNTKRFSLLTAPITRKYTETLSKSTEDTECVPYVRNKNVLPRSLESSIAYFNKWKEMWNGANLTYEYHFWRHQYLDVSGTALARRINEDIKAYYDVGMSGIIEDGSQRSFFPTGLPFYTYARTLYDVSLSYEEILEEYLSCAFGEDWKEFRDYLDKLGAAFDFEYMEGQRSANIDIGLYYNPSHAESLLSVREIVKEGRRLVEAHFNSDYRIRTVSVRLLGDHADYAEMLCEAVAAKALGKDDEADALFSKLKLEFGKREVYIEPYYDQGLVGYSLDKIFERRSNLEPIIVLDN
ncbi:MAG: DUF4838 domain-containing protein [Clostridia bacterium]|nr:DUF4838 domain-containing protein [Clostridia bacterium]